MILADRIAVRPGSAIGATYLMLSALWFCQSASARLMGGTFGLFPGHVISLFCYGLAYRHVFRDRVGLAADVTVSRTDRMPDGILGK